MLKQMRSGAHSKVLRYFFFGLLLMGTVGLALFGVQDVFRRGFHSETLATVGHDSISKTDLDHMVMDALRSKKMSRDDAIRAGIPQATLEREINSRIFIRAANDMGIVIDDTTVRRQIDSMLKPMMEKGLTEKQALDNILQTFGYTEGNLVATMKSELAVDNLSHALADGAFAPPEMVDDFMKYSNEWRRGDYVKLTAADADVKEPTTDDLQQLYKAEMQIHYMQPEIRKFSVLVLDAQSLPGEQKPAMDAKAFYDQHKTDFTSPEKRVVSEIAVTDPVLAQNIYSKAAAKRDMKEIAAEAGKDKAQFTSDTYTLDSFIPEELAADVFKAAAGAVLPPQKGTFGKLFIARVDKVIPASVKSFEDAKADIEKGLASMNAGASSEALYNRASEIDEMIGSGKSLAEVAQHFNLKTVDFNGVDSRGNDASGKKADDHGVPGFDEVLKAAWGLDKGSSSQPAQTKTGQFFVVELHDIQPAQAKPFESVRADVLQAWKEKQAGMTLDAKADKLMQRLNMGETLEKVAADLNKPIQHTALIQRNAAQQKGATVDASLVSSLFSIYRIGESTVIPAPGSVTILRLAERKIDADKPSSKEDVAAMQSMLSQALQSDILDEFRRSLMAKYGVSVDEQALKRMYAAQDGSGTDEEDTQQQ